MEQATLTLAEIETQQRRRRIADAWAAYRRTDPPPLQPTKSTDGNTSQVDDDVKINMSKVVVNSGVYFLFGEPITFEIADTQTPEGKPTPAQAWLDATWTANRQAQRLTDLALNGAIAGHCFYKLLPDTPYPRIVVVDPSNVDMICDPEDVDTVTTYILEWNAVVTRGRSVTRRQTITRQDGGTWRIVDEESDPGSVSWRVLGETDWPYQWPPVGHCKNLPAPNEVWGTADLEEDVVGMDSSLRFLLSNLMRIVRFHAHPRTVAKGMTARQIESRPDGMVVLPSPQADIFNLEMQSDLASSLAVYQAVKEALHQMASVPEIAAGKVDNVGILSGVALKVLYAPLLQQTATKRTLYGYMLTELSSRLLELGGHGPVAVTIHWPELLPTDRLAEAQQAESLQRLGVSVSTLLQRLGFDPALEADRRSQDPSRAGADLLRALAGDDTVPNESL